jgi:hypothetical protein
MRTIVVIATVAACAGPTPSGSPAAPPTPTATAPAAGTPSASPDAATVYRTIAVQVSAIRGLDAPERVDPTVIDRGTLQANLASHFDQDNPPERIARTERIYEALGFLDAGASLRALYLELQGSQVIGYYDPTAKQLFIVSSAGVPGPTERLTYAHEFTHELQDRHFDIGRLGLDKVDQETDRGLAVLSLVEGDAVSAQTAWMTANLTPAELGQVAAEASDPAVLATLAKMPPILLETSLFPYQGGAAFVSSLQASGGYGAVNAAFSKPPVSTEQILHPEKYAAGEGPLDLQLPADLAARFGPGWSVAARDTMGELQLRVWLRQGGLPGDVARTAADGWGADRLALLDGPGGASVLVLVTAWDTRADADAFAAAAQQAIVGLGKDGRAVQNGSRVVIGLRTGGSPDDAALAAILARLAAG